MTKEQLSAILGKTNLSNDTIFKKAESLTNVFEKYGINTPLRQCHYLAQVLHETGGFIYKEEIWGDTPAQMRYDTRADLGNTPQVDGDGKRYKGRGDIQVTGPANYKAFGSHLGLDFITGENYKLLATEPYCTLTGGWFWSKNGLNSFADRDNLNAITKRINGGNNGLEDRRKWLLKCKSVLMKRIDE